METTIDFTHQGSCHYLYAVVDATATVGSQLENADLSLVSYRDIACVLTTVPTSEYRKELPAGSSEQLEWIAPRVMKHHQVLMQMMAHTPIVPFKFGTLCETTADARSILATRYEQMRGLLEQLRGKEEWAVSVYVDTANVAHHVEKNEQQIQKLDSLIAQKTGGEAYLLRKKKEQVSGALQRNVLDEVHNECHRHLQRISDSILETPCDSPADSSLQILSATVLLPSANFERLEQAAAEIEDQYSRYSASLCLSGPWPAYATVTNMLADA